MFLVDIGNKFNQNGKNLQVEYSRKYIEKSPGIIGLKNNNSVVILRSITIESNLIDNSDDLGILKISKHIYLSGTGLNSDILLIHHLLVSDAINYMKSYGIEISPKMVVMNLENYLRSFSSHINSRVISADFMIIAKQDNEYSLYCTTSDLIMLKYQGCVIGSPKRRAKTELESYNLNSLDCNGLIDAGVKTFFKSFDPLVDKPFTLEVATISEETEGKFYRLSSAEIDQFIQRHKDLTVENEED